MTGPEQYDLLSKYWTPRARRSEAVHYNIATHYGRLHSVLTLTVVVLTAVTASTLFANLTSKNTGLKVALGILSVTAAVITGIDRSAGLAQKAEQHRQAGAAWCPIVNQTEAIIVQLPAHPIGDVDIAGLEKTMSATTAKSPYIPQHYFNKYRLGETYVSAIHTKRLRRPGRAARDGGTL